MLLDPRERYAYVELNKTSELLEQLEQRVADLTGIPLHQDESPFMLSVSRPWKRRYEGEGASLQNLHHDQNEGPGRVATVLIYLSGDGGGGAGGGGGGGGGGDGASRAAGDILTGGETIFPCVGSATGRNADLCRRLDAGYAAGERILWPSFYQDSFDKAAADDVSAMCRLDPSAAGSGQGQRSWLSVIPLRGAALLFLSAEPDAAGRFSRTSRGSSRMWHGGCRVWRGEKWTLQKFKELPSD